MEKDPLGAGVFKNSYNKRFLKCDDHRLVYETKPIMNSTEAPLVEIILPHYSDSKESSVDRTNTLICLDQISRLDYPNFGVTIIDGGSQDNFAEKLPLHLNLRLLRYGLIYLRTDHNPGYSASCNTAVSFALHRGTDFVFLINNDTFLHPKVLTRLVEFAQDYPQAGTIGPKIYIATDTYKTRRVQTLGGRFWGGNYGGGKLDRGQFEQPTEVDFVTGAACLIKREILQTVGLFDPRFSIWFEDLDFGINVREAGFKAYYCPGIVWHKRARSASGRYSSKYAYLSSRNLLYTIKKHPNHNMGMQVGIRFLANELKTLFGAVYLKKDLKAARALLRGIKDGIKDDIQSI